MAEEQHPLLEDSAADPPITAPQPGTLDVDLVIRKLLGYKNNPGKQVRFPSDSLLPLSLITKMNMFI